jgi:hypothetical protein
MKRKVTSKDVAFFLPGEMPVVAKSYRMALKEEKISISLETEILNLSSGHMMERIAEREDFGW